MDRAEQLHIYKVLRPGFTWPNSNHTRRAGATRQKFGRRRRLGIFPRMVGAGRAAFLLYGGYVTWAHATFPSTMVHWPVPILF